MKILCAHCGKEFESPARVVVHKVRMSDDEEGREEVPLDDLCPDCQFNSKGEEDVLF